MSDWLFEGEFAQPGLPIRIMHIVICDLNTASPSRVHAVPPPEGVVVVEELAPREHVLASRPRHQTCSNFNPFVVF